MYFVVKFKLSLGTLLLTVRRSRCELCVQPGIFVADQMEASYDGVNETAVSFTAP